MELDRQRQLQSRPELRHHRHTAKKQLPPSAPPLKCRRKFRTFGEAQAVDREEAGSVRQAVASSALHAQETPEALSSAHRVCDYPRHRGDRGGLAQRPAK